MTAVYVPVIVPPRAPCRQAALRRIQSRTMPPGPRGNRLSSSCSLKVARRLGTFARLVRERVRSWGVVGAVPRLAAVGLVVFAILYLLFISTPPGRGGRGDSGA